MEEPTEMRKELQRLLNTPEKNKAFVTNALFNRLLVEVARGRYDPIEALHWACAEHRNTLDRLTGLQMRTRYPHPKETT